MKQEQAIAAFAALANETRLIVFRALIESGPSGSKAGDLSTIAGVSPSNLTFHAANLERAGLVCRRRQGREIHYAPCIDSVADLMRYLAMQCCQGDPAVCGSLDGLPLTNTTEDWP